MVKREINAMAEASAAVGVPIVTGDTKVVERGKCDEMYINTTGIGRIVTQEPLYVTRTRPGDKILVSGYVGDHGVAIMITRGELELDAVRGLPGCERAALIGEARAEPPGRVLCKTAFGGHRMIDLLVGDPLPRIC